jgi:hypothetical protein
MKMPFADGLKYRPDPGARLLAQRLPFPPKGQLSMHRRGGSTPEGHGFDQAEKGAGQKEKGPQMQEVVIEHEKADEQGNKPEREGIGHAPILPPEAAAGNPALRARAAPGPGPEPRDSRAGQTARAGRRIAAAAFAAPEPCSGPRSL